MTKKSKESNRFWAKLGQILLIYWEYQILLSICIWPQIPNTFKVFVFDPKYQILNPVKYYFKYSSNTFLKKNLSFSFLCTQLSILPWKSCMESQQRSKNAKTCTTIKYDSRCLKMNNLTDWRLLGRSKVRDYTFYIKTS